MRSDRRRCVCSVLLSASFCWGKINGDHFIHESRNNDRRVVKNNCLLISTFPLFLVAPSGPPVAGDACPPFCIRIQSLFFFTLLSFHGKAVEQSESQRWHERESVSGCVRVLHTKTRSCSTWRVWKAPESSFWKIAWFLPTSPPHLSRALLTICFHQELSLLFLSFFCCASTCPEWADRKWGRS